MSRLLAAPVVVAALLLLLFAAAGMSWIWLRTGRPDHLSLTNIAVLLLPAVLMMIAAIVWGVDNERLAIIVWAVFMFGAAFPAIYALSIGAATGSNTKVDQWPFALGYGLAYLAVSFLFVAWIATWISDLAPPENAVAVSPQTLRARLLALGQAAPGLEVDPGQSDDVLNVTYRYRSGKRNTQVRLRIDAEGQRLFSRTYEGIGGDAPMTPNERQMKSGPRRVGELHPDADMVYSSAWTVTVPKEERRQQLGLRVTGDGLELPPEVAASFADDEGAGAELLPYLLSELTHQSGWRWSPRLIF